ncbi:MAG: hypothetical protein QW778_01850 [Candidatus Micrarchaeaceae archaeon]
MLPDMNRNIRLSIRLSPEDWHNPGFIIGQPSSSSFHGAVLMVLIVVVEPPKYLNNN